MPATSRVSTSQEQVEPCSIVAHTLAAPGIGLQAQGPSSAQMLNRLLRPMVRGKFIVIGPQKFYVRGVTYGPFAPSGAQACEYRDPQFVVRDFEQMTRHGFNTVRTYTVPPRWLLDLAQDQGLRVMLGLPWEQHIAFLDNRSTSRLIERRVREGVRQCAAHPAILCYTIGNEIPTDIARWHGRRRVEAFLHRLCIERNGDGEEFIACSDRQYQTRLIEYEGLLNSLL